LPFQPRPPSRPYLAAEIASQKRARDRCVAWAEGLVATRRDSRQARAMLSIVKDRLAQLVRSRAVPLRGGDGDNDRA
jgi:hypothetical protein